MKVCDDDALIVVDVQNDFCPGGALPVADGDRVVRAINTLQMKFGHIVLTRDWHPQDHCSFSDEPAYTDTSWPAHCVQDSPGAEFHGDLHVPSDAIIVNKGTDSEKEAYSGFEGTDLAGQLRAAGVNRVFITGLATDYCVKSTALDAVRAGFETVLVQDGCRGINDVTTAAAFEEMAAAGVILCRRADVEA